MSIRKKYGLTKKSYPIKIGVYGDADGQAIVRIDLPRSWRKVKVIYCKVIGSGLRAAGVEVSLEPRDGYTTCHVVDRCVDFATGRSTAEMPPTYFTCVECRRKIGPHEEFYVEDPSVTHLRICTDCFKANGRVEVGHIGPPKEEIQRH